MEERNKFNLQFIIKWIAIVAISLKVLSVLYDLSFGHYFAKQEQTEKHQAFLVQLQYAFPSISNVMFDRGNLEITIDVTKQIDKSKFKSSVTDFICERFTQSEAVININVRYSSHFKYPDSGKLLASWLLFAKNCI